MNTNSTFSFEAERGNNWGECAQQYSRLSRRIGFYSSIAEDLVALANPSSSCILDFGCGDGRFSRTFLNQNNAGVEHELTILLVDAFEEMLALTVDINCPKLTLVRIRTDERLDAIPEDFRGIVDTVACNSSFHLCRDPKLFVQSAGELLKPGGRLIANVPDQDYSFSDGWASEFSAAANNLWPLPGGPNRQPRFSDSFLSELARDSGLSINIEQKAYSVTWDDFTTFYSIPFMGARRMPHMTQQAERLRHLQALVPTFQTIEYRWVFAIMEKIK